MTSETSNSSGITLWTLLAETEKWPLLVLKAQNSESEAYHPLSRFPVVQASFSGAKLRMAAQFYRRACSLLFLTVIETTELPFLT
ncbi:hypothetical protein Ciccas_011130 [Cichlidogyrus casuarinus]|uniref:Uncharacterized protein n=1 Tax=Cichlidogyrus casuarinus TaxID=1844966 RepID=A0ABD2PS50_9PLAT